MKAAIAESSDEHVKLKRWTHGIGLISELYLKLRIINDYSGENDDERSKVELQQVLRYNACGRSHYYLYSYYYSFPARHEVPTWLSALWRLVKRLDHLLITCRALR